MTDAALLPPLDGEGGREAAGWGETHFPLHPLRLASLGTSPVEGEEGVPLEPSP